MRSVPLTDYLHQKASRGLVPLNGTFELWPQCNFRCRMCYVRRTAQEVAASQRGLLSAEDWLRIARQARERGMLFLLLTGGEPLLHPDFWRLYEELTAMGFLISINTNGSLLTQEAVDRFERLPPRRISVTLYGGSRETYRRLCGNGDAYEAVVSGIDRLSRAGIPMKLNCSLTPDNVQDLEAMVHFAQARQLPLDAVSYMFPPVRREGTDTSDFCRFTPEEAARYRLQCHALQSNPQQHRIFLEALCRGQAEPPAPDAHSIDPTDGKLRCRAGNAAFWVTWDGWLTPCGLLPEPKRDLKKEDFCAAWDALAEDCRSLTIPGTCAHCESKDACRPCAAMAYAETGSPKGVPPYLCESTRHLRRLAQQARRGN